MKSIRVEVRQSWDAALVQSGSLKGGGETSMPRKPYRIDVVALDENENILGGIQRFQGETLIDVLSVLSMSYGHLYQQLKFLTAENRRLRARLQS